MTEPWTPRRCAAARIGALKHHGLLVRCANPATRNHDLCHMHSKTPSHRLLRPPWLDIDAMTQLETAAEAMVARRDKALGRVLDTDNYVRRWSPSQRWGQSPKPRGWWANQ
jgi:hypothetical protein